MDLDQRLLLLIFWIETKKYKVYVHNYSNETSLNGSVNISIYKNNMLDNVLSLDGSIDSRCIQVAEIYNNKVKYEVKKLDDSICR